MDKLVHEDTSNLRNYSGIKELHVLECTMHEWLEQKSNLLLSLVEGNRILEVGCGIGSLTQFIEKQGYKILAIDPSLVCISIAKQRGIHATFLHEDVTNKEFWTKYIDHFDCAIMSDVLEHIPDENNAIRNVSRVLKKNGVLILTVPASYLLYSEQDMSIGHIRRYSKKEILRKLKSNDLTPEICRYWNILGFIGWLIIFKLLGKKINDISKVSNLMRLYGFWLKLENHIKPPLGLTLIVKARKTLHIT